MSIQENYTSRIAYCFHIISGIFFFIAFSIVCRQWSGLLQLGQYFKVVYGIRGLIVTNIVFGFVDFISMILCATSPSLQAYFDSTGFEVVTFIEGVRNCVYSMFLSYYGLKLVHRFWHFSLLEQQVAAQKRGRALFGLFLTATGTEGNVFTKVVLRLTSCLVITSACFFSRICMLVAKMVALHATSSPTQTTPDFTLFGLLWFVFSDFIPRAVPTLAFIFLMRTKRPARDQIKETAGSHSGGANSNSFQFVRLAGDDQGVGLEGGMKSAAGEFSGLLWWLLCICTLLIYVALAFVCDAFRSVTT
jgi:hypothetical protein